MPLSEKNNDCTCTLDILMKDANPTEIKSEFPEENTLTFVSSKESDDLEATDCHFSSYLGVVKETTEMFMKYFDDGVPLRMAKKLHELNLTMSADGPKDLGDTSINPSETVINELYEMWEDRRERMLAEEKEKEGDGNEGGEEEEEEEMESEDDETEESPQPEEEFRIPPITKRRKSADHDFVLRETVNCVKSLTEAVTNRDEFAVYGEHIANKLRNSGRSRIEISLVQRDIDDIFLKLEMGMYEKMDNSKGPIRTSLKRPTCPIQFSTSSRCEKGFHSRSSESSMLNTLTTPINFDTALRKSDTIKIET